MANCRLFELVDNDHVDHSGFVPQLKVPNHDNTGQVCVSASLNDQLQVVVTVTLYAVDNSGDATHSIVCKNLVEPTRENLDEWIHDLTSRKLQNDCYDEGDDEFYHY